MTGTQWSGLAWSVRSSAEVTVYVSSHFFALNDRRDWQTELRVAAPWKSTTSNKQQKKEEHLHSKRSPCENREGKIFAAKCRQKHVQYVSVIAWVFDFRKFITITDVSLQPMYIACSPIVSICSQHGLSHQTYTKYLIPLGLECFSSIFVLSNSPIFLPSLTNRRKKMFAEENSEMSRTGLLSYHYKWYFLCRIWWFDFSIPIVISDISLQPICTGYSDILNVFLRFWFWFLSILS